MVLSRRVGSGIHQPLSKLHLTNFSPMRMARVIDLNYMLAELC
jgi:hypothetical protein